MAALINTFKTVLIILVQFTNNLVHRQSSDGFINDLEEVCMSRMDNRRPLTSKVTFSNIIRQLLKHPTV